ncbi:hypothetical protein E2C01_008597 [Portunus trituberculatus]|uniref:Uncharacterized protein n=1 Tax=Portunus trituberculatus TaxID=210409 RepID=A0A5B7D4C0_PORTR|nr:hypothetical protein [Portunus trituberculatus]
MVSPLIAISPLDTTGIQLRDYIQSFINVTTTEERRAEKLAREGEARQQGGGGSLLRQQLRHGSPLVVGQAWDNNKKLYKAGPVKVPLECQRGTAWADEH